MKFFGMSDAGLTRPQNQDSFAIVEGKDASLAIVCDGIGGHVAGDVASKLACDLMVTYFKENYDYNPVKWFANAIKKVNRAVYEVAQENPEYKEMGTTLVAAIFTGDEVYVFNVGDSRAYFVDEQGTLIQLTEDHSLVNELVKKQNLDLEQAKILGGHVITKAVGVWPTVDGDTYLVRDKRQSFLLCSDGLYNYVPVNIIRDILCSDLTIELKCSTMIEAANKVGGYDNITAVIVED